MNRFWALLLGCICCGLPLNAAERVLPAPEEDGFVYFTADEALLEPNEKTVQLLGNVKIIQKAPDGSTRTLTGENL